MPTDARSPPTSSNRRDLAHVAVRRTAPLPSGETSAVQSHARGHLVYAASGVLAVHTERGTSVVPASRAAWTPAGFTHYPDGSVKSERWYESGLSAGTARWWYPNGQLQEEISYDGRGSVVSQQAWNDDGTIRSAS
jgi:hypothetical protein